MKSKYFKVSDWNGKHPLATPYPDIWIVSRWQLMADGLDLIRETAGCPILITPNGGYRNQNHNRMIGGKPKSQHVEGRAADLKCALTPRQLHTIIRQMQREGRLPALAGLGLYDWGVHVDFSPPPVGGHTVRRWDESSTGKQTP